MTDEVSQGREPARRPPPGGRHRRTWVMAGVVLAFLVVVAVVGLFRGSPTPQPRPSGSPSGAAGSPSAGADARPLQLTGTRCAGLDGTRLTIGFGVRNRGTQPLLVSELAPTFPLGGLTPDAEAPVDRAACPGAEPSIPYILGPGDSTVLAFVLTPARARCVAPLVVDVAVSYGVDGTATTVDDLHAFPDLGGFDLPSDC